MKVRFAVSPGGESWDHVVLPALVDGLEAIGFDTVWLSDVPMAPTVDPIVGLSFVAGRTSRLKLGANLVPLGRSPIVLAKSLAQLDRLSNGRLLLSLVPGLDQPGERVALGGERNRGGYLDEVIPLLRRWWAGETVEHHSERFTVPGIAVLPRPAQDPLEVWLGGVGPSALDRAGRLSDGWLGAAVNPAEAAGAVATINAAAGRAGRTIDPEHFGLSIPYARAEPDDATMAVLRARRPDADVADIIPVGADGLRDLVQRLTDAGLSKFVVRPVAPVTDWTAELEWLADAVLDLQT